MATVGELADQLWEVREEKRELAAQEKLLNEKQREIENELLSSMQTLGLEGGKATHATFSLKQTFTPKVEDWDAFYKYVQQTGYFHLLHQRLSGPGCKEIFEREHRLPGVIPETITSIRLTTRRDTNE